MQGTGLYSNIYEHWKRGKWYELPLLQYWLSLPPPDFYIDIGAHVGNHAVWAALAWPNTDILAYEPNIFAYHALVYNMMINAPDRDFRDIKTRNAAAWSDTSHDLYLRTTGPDEGMRQAAWSWEAMEGPFTRIASECVDDAVDLDNRNIIIKMDTEDRVWHPLFGAKETLRRNNCHLFVEAASDRAMRDLTAITAATGYKLTGKKWGSTPLYEVVKWENQ